VIVLAVLGLGWLPATASTQHLGQELTAAKQSAALEQERVSKLEQRLAQLEAENGTLRNEHASTKNQLNDTIKEKEAVLAELQEARRDLTSTLESQIAAGDVLIQDRNGDLVVDVSDKLLFEKGQAEISDGGKELLGQVAQSIRRLPPKLRFQVGGHTDSQRVVSPELVERYPTNWELSTARASNVVRHLQETGKVAGHKLIAAGFAQYRPASTNNTSAGRQKNRRIEIVVVLPKE
jgi:chemotaxis protein MotB